jgi:uncharacterized protein DUF6962
LPIQPSIQVLGLRIDEPVIAATDMLVTGVCLYAWFKLRQIPNQERPFRLFRLYFLLLGLATCWGGLVTHAFFYLFTDVWRTPGWLTGMVAITLLAFAFLGYHKPLISEDTRSILFMVVTVELAFVAVATLVTLHFRWTSMHTAFGLLGIVAPLSVMAYRKNKDKVSQMSLWAVSIFCVSGLVFTLKLSPHIWFNHVDLAHVFIAIAIFVFYRTAQRVGIQNG